MSEESIAGSKAIEATNRTLNRNDSLAVGVVNAAAPFLPVLLVRLGASGVAVGLVTALPAVAGALLALPVGRWLQGRRDIVPAYSGSRLLAHTIYAPMALALWLVPRDWAVAAILVIWAIAMVPNTIGQVAFPIVMDGAAGSRGRYELLGRRWAIIGLVTALTMAAGGQLLRVLPFPENYADLPARVRVRRHRQLLLRPPVRHPRRRSRSRRPRRDPPRPGSRRWSPSSARSDRSRPSSSGRSSTPRGSASRRRSCHSSTSTR